MRPVQFFLSCLPCCSVASVGLPSHSCISRPAPTCSVDASASYLSFISLHSLLGRPRSAAAPSGSPCTSIHPFVCFHLHDCKHLLWRIEWSTVQMALMVWLQFAGQRWCNTGGGGATLVQYFRVVLQVAGLHIGVGLCRGTAGTEKSFSPRGDRPTQNGIRTGRRKSRSKLKRPGAGAAGWGRRLMTPQPWSAARHPQCS